MRNKRGLQTSSSLSTLGTDVLVNVTKFLKPCDIISLRQTCKALDQLTRLRTVWINALRSTLARHSVPELTFPLQRMSLPMLEHIALSPHRFISLLKKAHNGSIQPTSIRVLTPRVTNREKDKYGIANTGQLDDILLAPGGRYLATLSTNESFKSSLLSIWDLGLCGYDMIKPLARFMEPMPNLKLRCFFSDPQKPGVYYLVSVQRIRSSPLLSVFAHRVSLLDPPEISFLAKFELPTTPAFNRRLVSVLPGSGRVVVSTHHHGKFSFCVWDFLNNAIALLITPKCLVQEGANVFPYDDCIMVTLKEWTLVYNIPPLMPCVPGMVPREHQAAIIVSNPYELTGGFYVENNPAFESPSADIPHYILRVDNRLTVLEVKDNNNLSQNPMIPNKLPIVIGSADITDRSFRGAIGVASIERCEEHLFLACDDETALSVSALNARQFTEWAANDKQDLEIISANLEYEVTVEGVRIQRFCPLLGRYCILTETNDVYIFDCLIPPEQSN